MHMRSLFALLAAGTIALAACGSDNSKSSSANAPAAAPTTAAASAATAAAPATTAAPTTAAASSATTDDDSSYGSGSGTATSAASASAATGTSVTLADSKLGKIVVDSNGMTLYAFLKDTGGTSVCNGACANAWPPADATGAPTAGAGITGALTTVARADGTMQLKLGDWPLYRFAGDAAKGDTNGQGSNSVWYVVGADGQPIK